MGLPQRVSVYSNQCNDLEETGLAACCEGNYARAIEQWAVWQEMDTGNPKPLMQTVVTCHQVEIGLYKSP